VETDRERGVNIEPPQFDVSIEASEVGDVQAALAAAGYGWTSNRFSGAELHRWLQGWRVVVRADWTRLDASEYAHDALVRDRLDVVLRALGLESRSRVEAALAPLDAEFRSRMRPGHRAATEADVPFWRANTIWGTAVD
jgi:hypothetical protein